MGEKAERSRRTGERSAGEEWGRKGRGNKYGEINWRRNKTTK